MGKIKWLIKWKIHWWNELTSEFIGIMSSFWNSRLKILKITILWILEISGQPGTLVLVYLSEENEN